MNYILLSKRFVIAIFVLFWVSWGIEGNSQCPQATVTIVIQTDLYGDETTWELYDLNTNTVITSGGPYPAFLQATYTQQVCVSASGCYAFVIYDAIGDGMCCLYGNGSYQVFYNGMLVRSGGVFATQDVVPSIGINCPPPAPPLITNDTLYTYDQLVKDVLLGSCVEAFNITYTGMPQAIGYFYNADALGIKNGVLLTSGNIDLAPGPNTVSDATEGWGMPGDADLDQLFGLSQNPSEDAAVLEFDFVAFNDTVTFEYIFASEEYPEFVCDIYNDAFAFLVTGPGYSPNTNIALIPGTSIPVAINSVNSGSPAPNQLPSGCISLANSAYYVSNTFGTVTEYDGYTVTLTATMVVVPCDTYHIKIVIADVGDDLYDSGVFLKAKSFTSGSNVSLLATDSSGTKNIYEGCQDGAFVFTRSDSSAIADTLIIHYAISGTAINGTDYQTIPDSVVILPTQMSAIVHIRTIVDGINEGTESIMLTYQDVCACNVFKRDTLFITDNQPLSATIIGPDSVCAGTAVSLSAAGSGSLSLPYTYLWSTGSHASSVAYTPLVSGIYSVTITDKCRGQSAVASKSITVSTAIASFAVNTPQCISQNSFDFNNTGIYGPAATFRWEMGDGTVLTTEDVAGYSYSLPGTYTVRLIITEGNCSDSASLQVMVFDTFMIARDVTICPGDSFFAGGAWQSAPGTFYDTLTASSGCDSVLITHLFINTTLAASRDVTICPGDSFFAGGAWQSAPGTFYDTLTASSGCDSVLITHLFINTTLTASRDVTICPGDSFFAGGAWQSAPGTFYDTLTASSGCDSVLITHLFINTTLTASRDVTICPGDSFFAGGAWQSAPGTFYDTLTASSGCDSVLQTQLYWADTSISILYATICSGDSFLFNGRWLNLGGTYSDTIAGTQGCDSIIELILAVENTIEDTVFSSICRGDSIYAGMGWQTASGIYRDTFIASGGCDSILTTILSVLDSTLLNTSRTICAGDSIFLQGAWQTAPGVFTDHYIGINGCDSIIVTTLHVSNVINSQASVTICAGDSFYAGGSFQTLPGMYHDTLSASGGCDSVHTTILSVKGIALADTIIMVCAGDSAFLAAPAGFQNYTWQPVNVHSPFLNAAPGTYQLEVSDTNGCLARAVYEIRESSIPVAITPDSASIYPGESVQLMVTGGSSNLQYNWTPSTGLNCTTCSTVTAAPQESITYTLIVTDSINCTDTLEVSVHVESAQLPLLYVPNAFSPNRDGINDEFKVEIRNFTHFRLRIFNRWGEKLFETTDPTVGWDGTYRGKECNPGVYVYHVEADFNDNTSHTINPRYFKGSLTLIR
ncbi:MAG: hypothetical protein KatS3mg031_2727 [Chitinophagales bacterium]|nr:MAG: hypothetical protein KatS3mg031_2727 [Chitinophagales bacterium]